GPQDSTGQHQLGRRRRPGAGGESQLAGSGAPGMQFGRRISNSGGQAPRPAHIRTKRHEEETTTMVRELVGHATVDHGGLVVIDPEYVDISVEDGKRIMRAEAGCHLDCEENEFGPVGAYVTSGLGDGRYPISAGVVEVPGAGKRVARLVVDFLGVEPESHELRGRLVATVDQLNAGTGWKVRLPFGAVDDDVRRRALS